MGAKMVSSCLIWVEYELNLSHLNTVRSYMCQFEEYPNYILMSILSLLKPSKANTFGPMNLWTFILIFCRCAISKSLWIACATRIWKFEIDSRIMWWCGWLKPPENRLHVSLVQFLFGLTSPRLCYLRSFRSTRAWTAHQYRKHPRHFKTKA